MGLVLADRDMLMRSCSYRRTSEWVKAFSNFKLDVSAAIDCTCGGRREERGGGEEEWGRGVKEWS